MSSSRWNLDTERLELLHISAESHLRTHLRINIWYKMQQRDQSLDAMIEEKNMRKQRSKYIRSLK